MLLCYVPHSFWIHVESSSNISTRHLKWLHLSRMLYMVQTEIQMLLKCFKPGTPIHVWHLQWARHQIKKRHLHHARGILCPVLTIQSQANALFYGTCLYYHAHKMASEAMNIPAKPKRYWSPLSLAEYHRHDKRKLYLPIALYVHASKHLNTFKKKMVLITSHTKIKDQPKIVSYMCILNT